MCQKMAKSSIFGENLSLEGWCCRKSSTMIFVLIYGMNTN